MLGDALSHLLKYDLIAEYIYRPYSKLMGWSCELDEKGRVWKFPEKSDEEE